MADASLYIYPSEANIMTSSPLPVAMTIEDQPYGSISADSGPSLGQSSDYRFQEFHDPDHNMEGTSPASSPSNFSQWHPPSSPTPAFPFQSLLDIEWSSPQLYQSDMRFNDLGNAFHATHSDGYTQSAMSPADGQQLSERNYLNDLQVPSTSNILSFPGITANEDRKAELHAAGNLSAFPFLSSPLSHDAGTAPLSHGHPPLGVPSGSHSRAEHEQNPEQPSYPATPTRAFTMHSYDSPPGAEDRDYKKNPEAMRNSWIADYSRFLDGNKVFKIFSKHAKEKVATINTLKASAARRRNPAKFKCSIEGCGADFTRKHNLENHLKSHCGVTDRICILCGKGFTTIPVCKRHQKSCIKSASSNKGVTPKGFLDEVTAQRPA